jgi:nicotinate-nucleotide adenylyltransferase
MTSQTRIGIFGGTFDPPHIGHLILAAEARAQLSLQRVLWVLTPYPPHKAGQAITPLEERIDLVEATISDNPEFELSRVDLDRPAPHYAVDSVNLLRNERPAAQLIYLMGGDSLADLPTWHAPGDFLAACDSLGVLMRPGYSIDLGELEIVLPGIRAKVHSILAPMIDISASDLRLRIPQGRPFRYFLHPGVYDIILAKKLYGLK